MLEAVSSRRAETPEALYLDLLKKCLTRYLFADTRPPTARRRLYLRGVRALSAALGRVGHGLPQTIDGDPALRIEGRDWPADAETMIGLRRLDNLEECIVDVLRRDVPGDLVETGVWRGGAAIFMRGVLKAHGDESRVVWAADSFAGLPRPDADRYPADRGNKYWRSGFLRVSLDEVKANFERYGLLDDRVRFLDGWFRDTLPSAPIERLGVLRLDGDLYESTIVALRALYPKLSVGGYVIVDDWGPFPGCRAAVEEFRAEHGITDELEHVDWSAVYWRRSS
jgi:O-methyltransferase